MTAERTALYRMFNADGALLYVGITRRLGHRWDEHVKTQPWWPEVKHQTAEWYPSRGEAESAERAAIRTEKPKYNKAGAGPPRWHIGDYPYPVAWTRPTEADEEVRRQVKSELRRHTQPRDKVINMLLACIPPRPHGLLMNDALVDSILRDLEAKLRELGEDDIAGRMA